MIYLQSVFAILFAATISTAASAQFAGNSNTKSPIGEPGLEQSTPGMLLEVWGPLNVEDVVGRDPSVATSELVRYVPGVPVSIESDGNGKIRADIYPSDRFSGVMHRFTNWKLSGVLLPPELGRAIVTTRITSSAYTACVAKTSFEGVPDADLICDGFCWHSSSEKTFEKAMELRTESQVPVPFSIQFACHYAANSERRVLSIDKQADLSASVSLFYLESGTEHMLTDAITALPASSGPFGN